MSDTTAELATRAESRIAGILAALEIETDSTVESIDIRNLEVTTITDDRPQLRRAVVIKLYRHPGSQW